MSLTITPAITATAGAIVRHDEGEQLHAVADTITVKLAGDSDESGFELFLIEGPQDSGPPPHAHPWFEHYFVLDGEVEVFLDDVATLVRPGDFVRIPAGSVHHFRVASAGARFLVMTGGSGASAFFRDLDANAPHGLPTAESLPAIIEVAKRNKLTSPLF